MDSLTESEARQLIEYKPGELKIMNTIVMYKLLLLGTYCA